MFLHSSFITLTITCVINHQFSHPHISPTLPYLQLKCEVGMIKWRTWYNWLSCRPSSPCSTGGSCTRRTAALSGQNPTQTYDHLQQPVDWNYM